MIHLEPFVVQNGELPPNLRPAESQIKTMIERIHRVRRKDALTVLGGLSFIAKVTEDSHKVIGLINFNDEPPARAQRASGAWIDALYVDPEYRWKNTAIQPVAETLVERVVSLAMREGHDEIALASLHSAKKFWQRHGFLVQNYQPPDMYTGTDLMVRKL